MVIKENVPASIRTWACCQVKIRKCEKSIQLLEKGAYPDWDAYAAYKHRVHQYRDARTGKRKYLEEYCAPERLRLKRCCDKYRDLAEKIRRQSAAAPENWLLAKDEALAMIGSTPHYRRHGRSYYETLQSCSVDGEEIFSEMHPKTDGLTPLSLLSPGFGDPRERRASPAREGSPRRGKPLFIYRRGLLP